MTKMPKEECEDLMNALLPVVKKLLSEHVEFFPVGGTMQTDGSIAFVSTYDGDEHPPSQKVIDSLMEVFRAGAKQKKYKATALIYDIRTIPPEVADPALLACYQAVYSLYPPEYAGAVDAVRNADGTSDSVVACHSLIPEALRHMMSGLAVLYDPRLPLSRRQHEMIATVVSALNRCHY